ncbi:hypothetical protein CIPAW_11G007700 [Carya illinoinensis]|uniref:Uncharacterized protein n=1 Tax=Carya illinoinensis TaxID=32201 RepID=A0A8T1NS40_CARIL|nr:hypothetical protein CIPAW_11G007700 [Carya illinoinensis]
MQPNVSKNQECVLGDERKRSRSSNLVDNKSALFIRLVG